LINVVDGGELRKSINYWVVNWGQASRGSKYPVLNVFVHLRWYQCPMMRISAR